MAQPLQVDKNLFDLITYDSLNRYFIASTHNKKLLLYKHNLKYPLLKLNSSSNSKKTALCFFDDNTIINGDIDGNLEFISLSTNKSLKNIHIFSRKIQRIIRIPNTNYLILHANTNTMVIVDAKNYKIVHNRYKEFKQNISNIILMDDTNIKVRLNNGESIDIELPSSIALRSLILHNSIKKAFALLEKEPMLENTLEAKSLADNFNKAYKGAVDSLSIDNKHLANHLLDIYSDIPSKKVSLKLLFASFKHYDRFKTLHKEKKFAICYAISSQYTPLKMTKEYIAMEKRWEKLLKFAIKEVSLGNTKSAKTILNEFITVNSKREKIQSILLNKQTNSIENKQIILKKLYEQDNFFACYGYIDKYPELYQSELGSYLQKHYAKLIYTSEDYAINGDIKMLKTTLGELIKLPSRKDRAGILLGISFLVRIQKQLLISDFNTTKGLIYNYIDLFSIDEKIAILMEEYEELSQETLAITLESKSNWLESDFIND